MVGPGGLGTEATVLVRGARDDAVSLAGIEYAGGLRRAVVRIRLVDQSELRCDQGPNDGAAFDCDR